MAPLKRTRAEETIEVLESASSSFRASKQKRPRLSTRDTADDSDRSDDADILVHDDGNGEYTSTQIRQRGGNREQYERERDLISDDADDDAGVERATQDIRRQKELRRNMKNQAADAGIIESVTCINFMCHLKLVITLGPLINFVIGHNGSGKSAILTALTLCLGGKATSTNRGQNLKSFIKEGQESSTLIVKIKNQGDSAYRRDIYGDSIIVERHFSLAGSSGFRIKSANGRLISTKRSELDEITDFYALQLDNPVNVLTQDMARQFLNNSSEADKYKFFVKGVQLEQLDNDYTLLSESLDGADAHMENIAEDIKVLQENHKEAKEKFQTSRKQAHLRERIKKFSRQMAWAQVEEQEKILETWEAEVQKAQDVIDQRKVYAQELDDAYETAKSLAEASTTTHDEQVASLEPLKEQQQIAKDAFGSNSSELLELQTEQRSVKANHLAAEARVQRVQKEIKAEKERLEAANGGSNAARLTDIEEAEQSAKEVQRELEQHPRSTATLESSKTNAEKATAEAVNNLEAKRAEIENAERLLGTLRNRVPQPLSAYHNAFKAVVQAIRSESRFHQKPVGPMGEYVRLLKPEWSSILESYFGGTLNNFLVVDQHDQKLLASIIKRSGCHASINIIKADRMETSQHEPDPEFDTILRVLEFDNQQVRNQLILGQNIEQVALIRDRKEAYSVMFDKRPNNVKSLMCFHDHHRGQGIRYAPGTNGGQKSDPIKSYQGYQGHSRMKTDTQTQIRLQEETCRSLKQELTSLETAKRTCEEHQKQCAQAIVRYRNQTVTLTEAVQRADDHVLELKNQLEALSPQDGKLDGLKVQLETAEDERNHVQTQLDESVSVRDELNIKAAALKTAVEAVDKQVKEHESSIKKANDKVVKLADKRQAALRQKNEAFHHVADGERDMQKVEANKTQLARNVEDFIRQATQICERVPVDRGETAASIDKKLDMWDKQLKRWAQEIGGTEEELARNVNEASEKLKISKHHVELLENLSATLKESLSVRHYRWKKFRAFIAMRARANFMHLLKERAFDGKMILDHREKMLQLLVQPDAAVRSLSKDKDAHGRQTKTLSGGEKSFSTICLLLALWDAMGSPIRCLDEFDVFMDSVNRDISMRMMIHAARGSVGRQFILITPQAMGNVDVAGDIKVIRLLDPERGQTALSFGAA